MLDQKVELLYRSAKRMMDSLALPRDPPWWNFIKKEAEIQVKRAEELVLEIEAKK